MAPGLQYQSREEPEENDNTKTYGYNDISLNSGKPALIHVILLNRSLRIIIVMGIASVLLPCLIYNYVYAERINTEKANRALGTCAHQKRFHIACGASNITAAACRRVGCCYIPPNGCFHTIPSRHGYGADNDTWLPTKILHPFQNYTPANMPTTKNLQMNYQSITQTHLKIELWNPEKYEGSTVIEDVGVALEYNVNVYARGVIEVKRTSNHDTILTTARGPLINTQNYFEWNVYLGSTYLYGLDGAELSPGFQTVLVNREDYNSLPFIMAYNNITTEFHAIVFNCPAPIEIEVLESSLIMFRSLHDTRFEINLFLGPTPRDIIYQIRANHPIEIPPYWALGVHICRNTPSGNLTTAAIELNKLIEKNDMPFDSHCLHDNLVEFGVPVLVETAREAITNLKNAKKKFIASVVSQINVNSEAYDVALQMNLLMQRAILAYPYEGEIANKAYAYIDWTADPEQLTNFVHYFWTHNTTEELFSADGFLLQRSWMQDETNTTNDFRNYSYMPAGLSETLATLTPIDLRLSQPDSSQHLMDSLNLMGPKQTEVVHNYLKSKKFIIASSFDINTRSAALMQNYDDTWTNLRMQVRQIVSGAVAGLSFMGSSVCGDVHDAIDDGDNDVTVNEELCIRWYQFASLTPLFRVKSDRIPSKFSEYGKRLMNSIIRRRYSLLGYFRSTMLSGHPLLTPMFYHYHEMASNMSHTLEQFNIGETILAAPVLLPRETHKKIYFPGNYYEIGGGQLVSKGWQVFPVVESDLPLFIRSGHILAMQPTNNAMSAEQARMEPFQLIVALECNTTETSMEIEKLCEAEGTLKITELYYLEFNATPEKITIRASAEDNDLMCVRAFQKVSNTINSIIVFGHPTREPFEIKLNVTICDAISTEINVEF